MGFFDKGSEARSIIDCTHQPYSLMVALMYRNGLRLMEVLRLRLKDIDFDRQIILFRQGKGNKDRVTILPESLVSDIKIAMQRVTKLHELDIEEGYGEVQMPYALARKYPNQARSPLQALV